MSKRMLTAIEAEERINRLDGQIISLIEKSDELQKELDRIDRLICDMQKERDDLEDAEIEREHNRDRI